MRIGRFSFLGLLLMLGFLLLLLLQWRLWIGPGSLSDLERLKKNIAAQAADNQKLEERNRVLRAEVEDLKIGTSAIEERARLDLGLVRDDETFYLIPPTNKTNTAPGGTP